MNADCIKCHRRNITKLVEKHIQSPKTIRNHIDHLNKIVDLNTDNSNVSLSAIIHREASQLMQYDDFYLKEKQYANTLLLDTYNEWEKAVLQNDHPLYYALKLAIIGNIIDYGAHSVPDNIEQYIHDKLKSRLMQDHSNELFNAISQANSILYLGDNAGEIVFDKLFIETINHPNITFAVRGKAVINDVTIAEAKAVGMDQACKVIPNGYDAPSTLLEHCSEEFQEIYHSADLIISKGQGNLEGLMHTQDPRLFFLLTAKCHYIANLLNVNKGDLVTINAQSIKHADVN